MTVQFVQTVADLKMAPEVAAALKAVELPEVRELMKQLAKYNLGVCIPHMHRADIDFDVLPDDTVQVERDCQITWAPRAEIKADPRNIPVAWRWGSNGGKEDAFCIQTCTPDEKRGHRRGHLKG